MWSARRAPWIAPTLCPRGEGMKIGESGPSPKRSAKVTLRAARVSAVCMTAFGSPVVLEVNMRWSRDPAGGGASAAPALAPWPVAAEVPVASGAGPADDQRLVPTPTAIPTAGRPGHCPAAAMARSPVSVRPWRSTVRSARAPQSSAA